MEVAATKVVLTKIAKMLTDEYKLHAGIKSGVEYLQQELTSMQGALEAVSQARAITTPAAGHPDRRPDYGQLRPWARTMRELAYDAEDTIDTYVVRVAAGAVAITIRPASSCFCCWAWAQRYQAGHRIAAEIERIKDEVREARERRDRFSIPLESTVTHQPTTRDPRLWQLYDGAARLVGMDRSTAELIRLLSPPQGGGDDARLKVVAVVGPGGIGKTTLANEVYNKLRQNFDCGAFVSVSLNPNMKSILSSILRQVSQASRDNTESWGDREVIDRIRDLLEDKRYFIVIDDIWDEPAWKYISCVFVENNLGSKIITTTRNSDVVSELRRPTKYVDGVIHELLPLSTEDSQKLFYYKVFGEERCPSELMDVSQEILKRCAGLPLAIVTIASILSGKQTMDEWLGVRNSFNNGGLAPGVEDMSLILSLSYYDLPWKLKPCLLYLSVFPEDHNIEKDDLIWRWICEGFVHAERDRNLYEVGEEYFNKLIERSMIQPVHFDAHGMIQTCRVHDIVLGFITSLSTEENFITTNVQDTLSPGNKIRRLSLRNSKDEQTIPQETMNMSHVRSLSIFSHEKLPLSSFCVLRVLDLEDCSTYDIGDIENLLHLRYLRVRSAHCIVLPKHIGNLQFLQSIDLKWTKVKELPSTVVQLKQLVRLLVDRKTQLPHSIGSMESLEELSEVDYSSSPELMEELGKLCKLRVLEISLGTWDRDHKEPLLKCLRNLKELRTLQIFAPDVPLDFMLANDWSWTPPHLRRFTACVRRQTEHIFNVSPSSIWSEFSSFSRLPNWIKPSLSNLAYLSIMVNTLPGKDLEVLGSLPALCSLDLHVIKACARERMEITGTTIYNEVKFRCLENFKFVSRAAGLVFKPGAMQRLLKLSLSFDVSETKYVHRDYHFGLENLTALKAVEIRIDCRCATLWEVHAVGAKMRDSINSNPNRPSLNLHTYFVRETSWEAMTEIPQLDTEKELEELTGIMKIGPWGGNGGMPQDISVAPQHLECLTICTINNVISSISFSYYDRNGQRNICGPWGGCGGNEHKIHLEPSVFLIKISGTSGMYGPNYIITSLTFITNAQSYGPYGLERGDHFDIPVHRNGFIVGFFGRAGWHIDALGVYVNVKEETGIAKFGPWGGNGGKPQDIEVPAHHLESVTIYSDDAIDSLAFLYSDQNGQCHTAGPWGGNGGVRNVIHFGHSEIVTAVYGTIGPVGELSDPVITSLLLVTNARSYGPFGQVRGTSFHIPMKSNGCIVAFFGCADQYINAIGVYTNRNIRETTQLEGATFAKIGLWGGNGGKPQDIEVPSHRLESVTIYSGGLIDSLAFSYRDQNEQLHTAGPWGGCGGNDHKIVLRHSEYVVKVSGTIGPWGEFPNVVTSLTLVTNAATYGPFGEGMGTSFHAPLQSNGSIVGFFVRASGYCVDAIGVHTRSL